jgi:hypothetical protein
MGSPVTTVRYRSVPDDSGIVSFKWLLSQHFIAKQPS